MVDQTQSSIVINAGPALIMNVIADLPSYPQWSDGIKEVVVLSLYEDDNRPADGTTSGSAPRVDRTSALVRRRASAC